MLIIEWMKISLRNMPGFVATYIVLHNLCIKNNERIKNDWVIEAKNKLVRRVF